MLLLTEPVLCRLDLPGGETRCGLDALARRLRHRRGLKSDLFEQPTGTQLGIIYAILMCHAHW